jgi:HEAT repeat protein
MILVVGFISGIAVSAGLQSNGSRLDNILSKFPAADSELRDEAAAEFLLMGSDGIREACRRLLPSGSGDDSVVRFALSGTSIYVNRTGGEKERYLFATSLLKALDDSNNIEASSFLLRLLQRVGKGESIGTISRYLKDKNLCEPATQALLSIGTSQAEKAFIKVLDSIDSSCRVTVIKAIGEFNSRAAIKKIKKYADSRDPEIRQAALFVLANSGDPEVEPYLNRYALAASSYERSGAPTLYLRYARRLAEERNPNLSIRICRDLIKYYQAAHEQYIAASALTLLTEIQGEKTIPELIAAADSPNLAFRARAYELSEKFPAEEITSLWMKKAQEVEPPVQAEIISVLGKRGDGSALPFVVDCLKSEDLAIRLASVTASVQLGYEAVLEQLIPLLKTGGEDEVDAVKTALLGFPSELAVDTALNVFPDSTTMVRAALIEILAARGAEEYIELVLGETQSQDDMLRKAALQALENLAGPAQLFRLFDLLDTTENNAEIILIQNAVVAASNQIGETDQRADPLISRLDSIEGEKKIDFIRPLSRIGGKHALQVVSSYLDSDNSRIQTTAVYTLAQWQDPAALDELLKICLNTDDRKIFYLAFQGYVRIIQEADLLPDEKFMRLKQTFSLSLTENEKKLVLSALSGIKSMDALSKVAEYMQEQELAAAAARAAVTIAFPEPGEEFGLTGMETYSILNIALNYYENPVEIERIDSYLKMLIADQDFVPLFNGRDLTGWKGLVKDPVARAEMTSDELQTAQQEADNVMRAHWSVQDGALVFDGKGESICTAKDYKDFELIVDWKIEPGGDSGLYLRGSPQVQIWDPAQWPEGSGGLYNNQIHPSKPLQKADIPIGEWNTFRIIMIGEKVTVYLNGILVVDNVVMENYWERDKPIYSSGQIELQAHNSPLYFRNIYICEIN